MFFKKLVSTALVFSMLFQTQLMISHQAQAVEGAASANKDQLILSAMKNFRKDVETNLVSNDEAGQAMLTAIAVNHITPDDLQAFVLNRQDMSIKNYVEMKKSIETMRASLPTQGLSDEDASKLVAQTVKQFTSPGLAWASNDKNQCMGVTFTGVALLVSAIVIGAVGLSYLVAANAAADKAHQTINAHTDIQATINSRTNQYNSDVATLNGKPAAAQADLNSVNSQITDAHTQLSFDQTQLQNAQNASNTVLINKYSAAVTADNQSIANLVKQQQADVVSIANYAANYQGDLSKLTTTYNSDVAADWSAYNNNEAAIVSQQADASQGARDQVSNRALAQPLGYTALGALIAGLGMSIGGGVDCF